MTQVFAPTLFHALAGLVLATFLLVGVFQGRFVGQRERSENDPHPSHYARRAWALGSMYVTGVGASALIEALPIIGIKTATADTAVTVVFESTAIWFVAIGALLTLVASAMDTLNVTALGTFAGKIVGLIAATFVVTAAGVSLRPLF